MITARKAIDPSWVKLIDPALPVGLGYDVGTSEKGTANPSAISAMQPAGGRHAARLIVSWKSGDPNVAWAIIGCILDDLDTIRAMRRGMNIDASNEVYHARQTKTRFAGRVQVALIKGNQKMKFRGEELDAKTLLGNLYVNALEDGLILLPGDDFIATDHRLVQREAGRFVTNLGPGGQHGDTFDACKLGYFRLIGKSGSARGVAATPVGQWAQAPKGVRPGLHNKAWVTMRNRRQSRLA